MVNKDNLVSRRSFLSGTAGTVVGVGVLSGVSEPIQATSDTTGTEQWRQPGGNKGLTANHPTGVGPTGELSPAYSGDVSGYWGDVRVGAVVDGTVYASGGELVALNADDGSKKWSAGTTIPDIDYPDGATVDVEAATVVGGTVVAPVRIGVFDGDGAEYVIMMGVDAESGEKRWEFGVEDGNEFSDVTAAADAVYVSGPDIDGSGNDYVYRLDPTDGDIQWRYPIEVHNTEWHQPAVADGRLYVAEKNGVVVIDTENGEKLWKKLPRVSDLTVAMVSEGSLIVFEQNQPGATIIALDAERGEQLWKQAYGGDVALKIPTADREHVYLSKQDDRTDVVALDRRDGSERWETTIRQPDTDDPPVELIPDPVGGMARVGSLLYAGGAVIDPEDGSVVTKHGIETPWVAPYRLEAVANGRLYFGGEGFHVMEGTETQTAEPSDPDQSTETESDATETPNNQTTTDDPSTSPSTTGTQPGTDATDETATTTTDGPGFGVVAALSSVGIGAWRYLPGE